MFNIHGDGFSNFKSKGQTFHTKGYFAIDSHVLSEIEIKEHFKNISTREDFETKIKMLNGCFNIVIKTQNKVYFSTDNIRSYPLFFSLIQGNLYLSDHYSVLLNQSKNITVNPLYIEELKSIKSNVLNNTIVDEIKQVDNGQLFEYCLSTKTINSTYYIYDLKKINCKIDFKSFENKLIKTFNRLIESANQRMVVVPLSGGYDSRLIVSMLKKLNYENVVCFSYGKKNSHEAKISQQVASKLNFKWHFVCYEETHLNKFLALNTLEKYMLYSGNLSSVPHFQDLYAVDYLTQNKLIDQDAIFVPGHSGDLLAGSHLTAVYNKIKTSRFKKGSTVSNKIYQHWYRNIFFSDKKNSNEELSTKNIEIFLDGFPSIKNELLQTDIWDISNRQSKFIVNSIRVYDFYNYEFRLPLWDIDYTKFWLSANIDQRINCKFYNSTLEKRLFNEFNIVYKKNKRSIKKLLVRVSRMLFHEKIISFLRYKQQQSYVDFNNYQTIIEYIKDKVGIQNTTGYLSIDDWSCCYYLKLLNKKYGIKNN